MSDNGNGVKPDGSKNYIYFILNSDFILEIYYTGISSSLKAFNTVTFQSIEGYYNQGGKDFTINFIGDNIDYKLHFNSSNIEISYV